MWPEILKEKHEFGDHPSLSFRDVGTMYSCAAGISQDIIDVNADDIIPTQVLKDRNDDRILPDKRGYSYSKEISKFWAFHEFAAVARSVPRSEAMTIPKAKEALDSEWEKLRRAPYKCPLTGKDKFGCWDESAVEEASDVRKR